MQSLSEIEAFAADQDRGRWLDLADPVTGRATGLRLCIAGPDSATQGRAQLALAEELAGALDDQGWVPAHLRAAARLNCLAACVLAWDVVEGGEPVPFTRANVLRLLRAGKWVQAQADAFAGDRRNFAPGVA